MKSLILFLLLPSFCSAAYILNPYTNQKDYYQTAVEQNYNAVSATVTLQGNSFNGANQLLKANGSGKLPASNLPADGYSGTYLPDDQTVPPALIDLSTVTTALNGKLSNTSTVPTGLIDLSTVTTALNLKADSSALTSTASALTAEIANRTNADSLLIPSSATGTYPLSISGRAKDASNLTFIGLPTSSTKFPTVTSLYSGIWPDKDNILLYDNIYTTVTTSGAALRLTTFGFVIPSFVTVSKLSVTYKGTQLGGATPSIWTSNGSSFVSLTLDGTTHTESVNVSYSPASFDDATFFLTVYAGVSVGQTTIFDYISVTLDYPSDLYSVGINQNNNSFEIATSSSVGMGSPRINILGGKVGISTGTPQYALDVNGVINSTGILVNGTPFTSGANLTGVRYSTDAVAGALVDFSTITTALSGKLTSPATFYVVKTSDYLVAPASFTYLSSIPNTFISSVTVSSNVYIVGYSSAAKYYGDGSSLTGISSGGGDVYKASTQTFTGSNTFNSNTAIYSATITSNYTTGFTQLGSTAPKIKTRKLTGTTAASQGGGTNITHGLTIGKILSVSAQVQVTAASSVSPGYMQSTGYQFNLIWTDTAISILLQPSNSINILKKPIVILVIYEE